MVTGILVAAAFGVRRHYAGVGRRLRGLNRLVEVEQLPREPGAWEFAAPAGARRTAVVLVGGFNGLGLHTLLGAVRLFGGFARHVFVEIGVVDAGNFKGADEIDRLRDHIASESERYVAYVRSRGGEAYAITASVTRSSTNLKSCRPGSGAFSGCGLLHERESVGTRLLHNFTGLELQRRLANHGFPCAIVPVRVGRAEGRVEAPAA